MSESNQILQNPIQHDGQELDDYTAKMERMVENLKKRTLKEHQKQLHMKLIWIALGTVITIILIYMMLNTTYNGEPLKFLPM